MVKYIDILRKYWVAIALLFIVSGAFAVRFYHFDEWLYFKMDQSRDALLISNAIVNGPAYLPLLGPRVGAVKLEHGMLRLGPAYYYFQYLSGKIFNSTAPAVFAYPDLFFSIAVLPLLFFFARLYFSRWNSLFITAMYAFSFLIIEYSRFAWNPNSLQFFIILSFYGLLRFLNEERLVQKKWWLALWAFGVTIGSQLHFFGFFSLLGISGLLILSHLQIWKNGVIRSLFQKELLKRFAGFALIVVAIFFMLYSPVILSDSMKGGQNTHNFFEALTAKADKKPLAEKLQKDLQQNLDYYCLLTTSGCYAGDYKKNARSMAVSTAIGLVGIWLTVRGLRNKKSRPSKDFLALTLIWFTVFTILTIPVAFQLRPRFYIVVFALPFIFLGLLYEYLEERFGKKAIIGSVLITAAILALNIRGTRAWFHEQASAQTTHITDTKRTLILKAKDGVTLGQLNRAADWIYSRHTKGDTLYYYVKPEHVRPIEFLLYSKHEPDFNFTTLKITAEPHAQYFAITPAKNGLTPVTNKFGTDLVVLAQEQFGQLMVYEINFPHRQVFDNYRFSRKSGSTDRIFWGDVFGIKKNKNALNIDAGE